MTGRTFAFRNPDLGPHRGFRTWLLGYTCQAHQLKQDNGINAEVLDCACKPNLLLRLAFRLGLTLELAPTPDPRWCQHTWPADLPNESHACELQHDHGAPEHTCDCGARQLTDRAGATLLRAVRLPVAYDDCLWPADDLCPRHDLQRPWPPGRDCTGTCTNCNVAAGWSHQPSCLHYDADADADYPFRQRKTNRKATP